MARDPEEHNTSYMTWTQNGRGSECLRISNFGESHVLDIPWPKSRLAAILILTLSVLVPGCSRFGLPLSVAVPERLRRF